MDAAEPGLNQVGLHVRYVDWIRSEVPCDRCGKPARRVWAAERSAIDLDLDHPVLLLVRVSVHHCVACRHYLRAQPSFLRPDCTYTRRVVDKAVASVYADGMATAHVAARLARDFWVRPSEKMVRLWCRTYAAGLELTGDYQQWVRQEFSGVLCVDEVYQGRLALLVAVDPGAPNGDRLIGYQLVHDQVNQADVEQFLRRLQQAGVEPEEVITDASPLYPAGLAAVWPAAAHQLCLFHETRPVTRAVQHVVREVRAALPKPPAIQRPRGRFRKEQVGPAEDEGVPYERSSRVALVQTLHRQGLPLRAIERQTGHSRKAIRRWLKEPVPEQGESMSEAAPGPAGPPEVGSTHAPVSPAADLRMRPTEPPAPAPWQSWQQLRAYAQDLHAHRFLLVRRPDQLSEAESMVLQALLDGPAGESLRVARAFIEDWYGVWRDDRGQQRSKADALERLRVWQSNETYRQLAPLRRAQDRLDEHRMDQLSAFLTHPTWQATNNGAERTARQFRHLQANCFKLRTEGAIDGAIKAWALHGKETGTDARHAARSTRGRRPHVETSSAAA